MSMHILPQTCEHTKEFLARQMLGFKLFRQCLGPTTLASLCCRTLRVGTNTCLFS